MLRNVLLFLAGVVVALGVLKAWDQARTFLFGSDTVLKRGSRMPGSGSNIRVVGGSVRLRVKNGHGLMVSTFPNPAMPTELDVTNADAWTYQIVGVSKTPGGPLEQLPPPYSQGPNETWKIHEFVNDPADMNRGVEITGTTGATPSSGTVSVITKNGADTFASEISPVTHRVWRYHNNAAGAHCKGAADPTDPCEKIRQIDVETKGQVDHWYCVDRDRACHVNIGDQP
jgi:hypothetical protein